MATVTTGVKRRPVSGLSSIRLASKIFHIGVSQNNRGHAICIIGKAYLGAIRGKVLVLGLSEIGRLEQILDFAFTQRFSLRN